MSKNKIVVNLKGFATLERDLVARFNKRLIAPMRRWAKEGAEDIAIVAQDIAPEKTGSLADAIEVKVGKKTTFASFSKVIINQQAKNKEADKLVKDYALEAHELIEPARGATKKLGVISEYKNESTRLPVGGEYFTRAMMDMRDQLISRLKKILSDL